MIRRISILRQLVQAKDDERQSDYLRLSKKYEIASKNLLLHPDECGGEEHIKGYMSGLIEGMALLNPNLKSVCMEVTNG